MLKRNLNKYCSIMQWNIIGKIVVLEFVNYIY